ncbi:MAG: hypothetical protein WB783_04980 [Arenicellales bacterium]|jgi:maleate isomerase
MKAKSTVTADGDAPVCEFDEGPGRYRIGLVVLASDHATERDFRMMTPTDEMLFYVSRVRNEGSCNVEELIGMAPRLEEAASLLIPDGRLDALAYSCTSASIVIGVDAVRASLCAHRPGVPCATPITGALAGMARLGVRRVAMLSPYIEEVTAAMHRFVEARGVEVVALRSFNLEREIDLARLTPHAIYEAAVRLDRPDAEAIFIPCTAIRAVEVIETLEKALSKPVLTSIQALFWEAVRFAGYASPIPGFGRLLLQ